MTDALRLDRARRRLCHDGRLFEPGAIDHKLYVRGVGTVLEQTEKGGNERLELVSYS